MRTVVRIYTYRKKRGDRVVDRCVLYTQNPLYNVADVQDGGRTMYNNLIPIIIGYGKKPRRYNNERSHAVYTGC